MLMIMNKCTRSSLSSVRRISKELERTSFSGESIASFFDTFSGVNDVSSSAILTSLYGILNIDGLMKKSSFMSQLSKGGDVYEVLESFGISTSKDSLDAFSKQFGEESFAALEDSLNTTMNPENTVIKMEKDMSIFADTVSTSEKVEGKELSVSFSPVTMVNMSEDGTELYDKRKTLAKKVEGLKEGSSAVWTEFLNIYFPSLGLYGADFTTWAKDYFHNIIIDFSEEGGGLLGNVGNDMIILRAELENGLEGKRIHKYDSNSESLLLDQFKENDGLRDRYFNEVLYSEFDFILANLIKIIQIDSAATEAAGDVVTGFRDETGSIPGLVLDISKVEQNFYSEGYGKGYVVIPEDGFSTMLTDVAHSIGTFKDAPGYANNSYYHTLYDNKYIYKDLSGVVFDISPVPIYKFNGDNKVTQSSINRNINPLNHGTAFINNMMSLIPIASKHSSSYGKMSLNDFMLLAPFFINNATHTSDGGRTIKEFTASVFEMSEQESRLGDIARGIYTYILSLTPQKDGDGTIIYSLMHKANNGINVKTNTEAVNALMSALTSKEYLQFLQYKNGVVNPSWPLKQDVDENTMNIWFSKMLLNGNTTKKRIADLLYIDKSNKIYIRRGAGISTNMLEMPTLVYSKDVYASGGPSDFFKTIDSSARLLGFSSFLEDYKKEASQVLSEEEVEMDIVTLFISLVRVAAANKKNKSDGGRWNISSIRTNRNEKRGNNYLYLTPSTLLYHLNNKFLTKLISPDTTKQLNVAGESRQVVGLPNRNSYLNRQIDSFDHFNLSRGNKVSSNPFLKKDKEASDQGLPKAVHRGYFIKVPISKGSENISVTEMDLKTRLEQSFIQGFLDTPALLGQVGETFLLQPVNFSDKKAPQVHEIHVEQDYFFKAGSDNLNRLKEDFIEYNIKKNDQLQAMVLTSFTRTLVGNYETFKKALNGNKTREKALKRLSDYLIKTDFYAQSGDITKKVNELLKRVKISESLIKFSGSDLNFKSDYVTFESSDSIFINPIMGIRSEDYIKNGNDIVDSLLTSHRDLLKNEGVDDVRIKASLKKIKRSGRRAFTVNTVRDFYDRAFLVNGIYGHSLKTIMMGDETFFTPRMRYDDIDAFYASSDEHRGLAEQRQMLKGQFKRSQSIQTAGQHYVQKDTVEGLKQTTSKENLIHYLDISEDVFDGVDVLEYHFDSLLNKSYTELQGLGVVPPTSVFKSDGVYHSIQYNVGDNLVTFTTNPKHRKSIMSTAYMSEDLYNAVFRLTDSLVKNPLNSDSIKGDSVVIDDFIRGVYLENITERDVRNVYNEMSSDTSVTLPDYMPTLLLTEPISYMNLINSVDNEVDNSDAAQYIHPLMHLILKTARGGEFSAFNTEAYEPMKFITTTFDYERFTQSLQKKAVIMPFSYEQMTKIGSVELYNALVTMNKGIAFRKKNMQIKDSDGNIITKRFENMHDLFTHFGGYATNEDGIWSKILEVLQDNPVNMFSFVGYLNVPTNQKTAQKQFNTFTDVFNNNNNFKPSLNVSYTANEFNFEVLSKAHEYDVSKGATIALLSQLVNAIAFGGVTKIDNMALQNALAGIADVNKHSLTMQLREIAIKQQEALGGEQSYNNVIKLFENDSIVSTDLNKVEEDSYYSVVEEGMQKMMLLAFNEENDSMVMKEIIEEAGLSIDSPLVYNKVMGTLRSALFKRTTKVRQSGFIAATAPAHMTVKIFTLPGDISVGRRAFIRGAFDVGLDGVDGEIMTYSVDNADFIEEVVLPFDIVRLRVGSITRYLAFGKLTLEQKISGNVDVVITPDAEYEPQINNRDDFNSLDPTSFVEVIDKGVKTTSYAWYVANKYSEKQLSKLLSEGKINRRGAGDYGLNWYQYTNPDGVEFKSTPLFMGLYMQVKAMKEGTDTSEERLAILKGGIANELKRTKSNGELYWTVKAPQVILPAFMKSSFGITARTSLRDILGYDGNDKLNASRYFSKNIDLKAFRRIKKGRFGARRDSVLSFFKSKKLFDRQVYYGDVIAILENVVDEIIPFDVLNDINRIIEKAETAYVDSVAESFLEMLHVVLTRIPGQSKQSAFNGNVVEFINAQGVMVMAPSEQILTTGGDFDIDTLSILTKMVTREGLIYNYKKYFYNKGFNKREFKQDFHNRLLVFEEELNNYIADINFRLESEINALQATNVDSLQNVDKIRVLKDKLVDTDRKQKMREKGRKFILEEFNNIASNAVTHSIQSALMNPAASLEINNPMDVESLENIADELDSEDELSDHYRGDDYLAIYISEERAAQGSEAIGVFATALKIYSAILSGKNYYDLFYRGKKRVQDEVILLEDMFKNGDVVEGQSVSFTGFNTIDIDYTKTGLYNLGQKFTGDRQSNKEEHAVIFSGVEGSENIINGGLKNKIQATIKLKNPKVMITDKGVNISVELSRAKKDGYDGIIIQNSEKYPHGAIAYILNATSISDTPLINDRVEEEMNNPFIFEHSIDITNEDGEREEKHVFGFSDIVSFSLEDAVDGDKNISSAIDSIENTLSKGLERFEVEKVSTLVNIVSDVINANVGDLSNKEYSYLVSELFGIKNDINNAEELKAYLESDPENLLNGYYYLLGSQKKDDVLSQFLTAATDNAQMLLLGRLKSNSFTNGIITTMLLMGYDAKSIILYINSREMGDILIKQAEIKRNFNFSKITVASLERRKSKTPFIKSLISILKVSDDIGVFRSLRSLHENFNNQQFKLDRILSDVKQDRLYEAIAKDDIFMLDNPKKVFNAEMMIFLHPLTRSLFVNLYETERGLIHVLSKTSKLISDNVNQRISPAYKNVDEHVAKLKVDKFLSNTDKEGNKRNDEGYVGVLYEDSKRVTVSLETFEGRGKFLDGFSDYLDYAKDKLNGLNAPKNILFDFLGKSRTFKSKYPVVSVPMLSSVFAEPSDISLIKNGVTQLTQTTGVPAVDALLKEIHQNLSLYALITSGGKNISGSMISLFDDINKEVAKYVHAISSEEYTDMLPREKTVFNMLMGTTKNIESLREFAKKKRSTRDYEGEYEEYGEDFSEDISGTLEAEYIDGLVEEGPNMENIIEAETAYLKVRRAYNTFSSAVTSTVNTTSNLTVDTIYTSEDRDLQKAFFLGAENTTNRKVAIQIFDSADNEAIANSQFRRFYNITGYNSDIISELSLIGKQVGLSTTMDNTDYRILAFVGTDVFEKDGTEFNYDKYMITDGSNVFTASGIMLMIKDPSLFLVGNKIEYTDNSNINKLNAIQSKIEPRYALMGDLLISDNTDKTEYSEDVKKSFSVSDIFDDRLLRTEAAMLNSNTSGNVMKATSNSSDTTLNKILSSTVFKEASALSNNTFIPSIRFDNNKAGILEYKNAVDDSIGIRLNNLVSGESVIMYGAIHEGSHIDKKTETGGDILNSFLGTVKTGKIPGFSVTIEDLNNGVNKYTITKNASEQVVFSSVNGEMHKLSVKATNIRTNPVYKLTNGKKEDAGAVIKAMFDDNLSVPHTKHKITKALSPVLSLLNVSDVVAVNSVVLFAVNDAEGTRKSTVVRIVTGEASETDIVISKKDYDILVESLSQDKNKKNNNC